jgi:hypothetical protein
MEHNVQNIIAQTYITDAYAYKWKNYPLHLILKITNSSSYKVYAT